MNRNNQIANKQQVDSNYLTDRIQSFCICQYTPASATCTHRAVCAHWRQLAQRTVRGSWLDRFLRAFVTTHIQGRVLLTDPSEDLPDPPGGSILFTPQEGRRLLLELKKAVTVLQDRYREPLALYLEGYTCREIAELLELTMTAVLNRIGTARKILVQLIGSHPKPLSELSEYLRSQP